jgi:glycosyltransferase involved in cell wall biosynthesis
VVIKTVDRGPQRNYLGDTLRNLARSGMWGSEHLHSLAVVDSGSPDLEVFRQDEIAANVPEHPPLYTGEWSLHQTAQRAIEGGAEAGADWVLVLEDDIDVCDFFLDAVARWLEEHARPCYRMYAFGANRVQIEHAHAAGRTLWRYPVGDFYGAQALAWAREDAAELAEWLGEDPDYEGEREHHHDLLLQEWGRRYGLTHFAASVPSFVQHIGGESSLGNRTFSFDSWQGRQWRYGGQRRHVLWVGDAASATGFARCTHAACDALQGAGWDVHVLGLNHFGDPRSSPSSPRLSEQYPYDIYPAARAGHKEDGFGVRRTREMVERLEPDAVVLLTDPWHVENYMGAVRAANAEVPVVSWLAVDGGNCRGEQLNGLALNVFFSAYGEHEAGAGGCTTPTAVVPLGVDLEVFYPQERYAARRRFGFPEEAMEGFTVGAVARNQPRKRLDLTVAYFAEWVQSRGIEDAYLMLHATPCGIAGYDLVQLGKHYGLEGRMFLHNPKVGYAVPEEDLALMYSAFDVQLSTSQGEGFGLTTLEGMACGVPSVVGRWAALGEWPGDAVWHVPCPEVAHTPSYINATGAVPERRAVLEALDVLYEDESARAVLRERGLALAAEPRYRWENVGAAMRDALESVMLGAWVDVTTFADPQRRYMAVPAARRAV